MLAIGQFMMIGNTKCYCISSFVPPSSFPFSGRQDSQVKVRGHRVNLREVENTIQNIPGVEAVVTLACDTKAGFR